MASEALHEPIDKLKPETINIHRAIVSLMEELEAIDWYRQRADACTDAQLRAILEHNMNEEIEHASMVLEWIRRNVPKFDESLKTYLFTTGNVVEIEEAANGDDKQSAKATIVTDDRSTTRTTIGDMKGI
jgi:ferritin-like protein